MDDAQDRAAAVATGDVPYSDELLVDMVRARENLFDKGRFDYKDEQAKAQAWDDIANAFGMRVEECQTRWVRLRERFGRELRLHKRGVPPGKEWSLFSRMRWLERFIQPRNRVGVSKAHVAAMHAALAREQRGLSPPGGLQGGPLGHTAPHLGLEASAFIGTSSESCESMLPGGEDASAATSAAGPLWPHTFKLWAAGDHHLGQHLGQHLSHHGSLGDENSQQDMAVDLATRGSHPSTPRQTPPSATEDYHAGHHAQTDAAALLADDDGPGSRAGSLPSPQDHFQDAVRQSLSVMACSLESIERNVARTQADEHAHAHDPDELFARSLAATLRRMPRSRRSQAKMKLLAVLAEFEEADGL